MSIYGYGEHKIECKCGMKFEGGSAWVQRNFWRHWSLYHAAMAGMKDALNFADDDNA